MATRTVLFDLDGTLVDNMRYHVQAWVSVCRELGIAASAEQFEREFAGKKNEEIVATLLGQTPTAEQVNGIAGEKEARYRELFRPELRLVPGALALLERCRKEGVRCAIASAAPPENRRFVLEGLQLESYFDAVVGAEQAARGKPFPDLFLTAATRMAAAPEDCLVFEDAENGVLAARAAGMRTVGISTSFPKETLLAAGASHVLPDFRTLPSEVERFLFS